MSMQILYAADGTVIYCFTFQFASYRNTFALKSSYQVAEDILSD